jgi:uncharacterized 2Fe-2S/4Fe-4S cluster protein (DUF4445 family)
MTSKRETRQAIVVFSPSGKRGRFPIGTAVLQAARELGVDIDSVCGGRALCGHCQVEPVEGRFAKEGIVSQGTHLSGLTGDENFCRQNGLLSAANRLSCQAKILGDIKIDVPPASQVHRQVVRKDFEHHPIELDPVIRLYFTQLKPESNLSGLLQALESDWGLSGLEADTGILQDLQTSQANDQQQVTVAVRNGKQIVALWAGLQERIYGAAVDVGSTTIAVQLCDLASGEMLASAGAMNPQIRYGEDLMSRVSYAMLNPGGAEQMTVAVRSAINDLLAQVIAQAGIEADKVLEVTLVGNPVMHHLLLGLDPAPLGSFPFKLTIDQATETPADHLGLHIAPGARAYTLPCIAGHVGADTAAVMLAETPWESDKISLVIDVGTNAEIILGNRDRLLAASSPTGPAFEGAQISAGQRAAAGAIERVRIDPDTLEARFKVIGGQLWSDEPGFADEQDGQDVNGICGSGIIEAIAEMYLAGIIKSDGVIDGSLASQNSRITADGRTFSYLLHHGQPGVQIRQADVRAIQLAKAALYAGARLLMDRMGVSKVDRIRLAGAFGSHIDVKYAMLLGMIPDCDLAQVTSAHNAAGTGARIALLSRASRGQIEDRVGQVEKVETSIDENFQKHFVEAMAIPHSTDSYPMLARVIRLPEPASDKAGSRRKNRLTR